MSEPTVGTREEWPDARIALLEREKEATRLNDEVTRQRLSLPWVPVEKDYVFETNDGPKGLADLFDGRSLGADHWSGAVPHLNAHDVTFVFASRATLERIDEYRQRMGWTVPWVSSAGTGFNRAFALRDGQVFHTYTTTDRGTDALIPTWHFLDRTPRGRFMAPSEAEAVPGWPKRNDEYDA